MTDGFIAQCATRPGKSIFQVIISQRNDQTGYSTNVVIGTDTNGEDGFIGRLIIDSYAA